MIGGMRSLPFHDPDETAHDLLRGMLSDMRHTVLAVNDAETGCPYLARVAAQLGADGMPLLLISDMATHTRLLARDPRASLLIAPPPQPRGDAMTQPRASLQGRVTRLPRDTPDHQARLDRWLAAHPKSTVYASLPDFAFWQMQPDRCTLNAGFGKAFRFTRADMQKPPAATGRGLD